MMKRINTITLLLMAVIACTQCSDSAIPKPRGFHRIDLPEHTYQHFESAKCPFEFDFSKQATIIPHDSSCWLNVVYPKYKAIIHLSYAALNNNLIEHAETSRDLVMEHIVKADDILEEYVSEDSLRVYGITYDFLGNTATNYQFYLTDSNRHFFRGALYFNMIPKADSIAPIANFIKEDIQYLIESFEWKE